MRKIILFFSFCFVFAFQGWGQTPIPVKLQATTPGVQQTGHINVSGTILSGGVALSTPNAQTENVFLGGAGNGTATGNQNIGVGVYVLSSLTTGHGNTAMGVQALYSTTTGLNNTAFGLHALQTNVTGQENTAIGVDCMPYNTASYNTGVGTDCLNMNTTGQKNTGIGQMALGSNDSGSYNTSGGYQSLYSNVSGTSNTAFGYYALSNNLNNYNTAVGFQAGKFIADGASANANSSSSTYIGYNTKASADADTNETVIGANAIGHGTNTATIGDSSTTAGYIGSSQIAELDNANTWTRAQMIDGSADEVQLTVQGNGTQTAYPFVVENSSTSDLFYVTNSGSVWVKNYLNLDVGVIEQATSGTTLTINGYQSTFTGAGPGIKLNSPIMSGTTASTGIAFTGAVTKTANAHNFVSIAPTYNEATGTAANTDMTINRTETAIGSGAQYLLDLQVGGISQWNVTNKGIQTTGIVADVALQYGTILMADAGTDKRFDVNGAGGTLPIGVLAGTGASAQGAMQGVVFNGLGRVLMDEDVSVTRGHVIFQDAGTPGRGDDNAALQAAGLNIGKALTSEGVTATISGSGGVNTTTGVITLGVDVAALGWTPGEPVVYYNSGGTSITGLTDGNVYWLLSVSTTNVTIAATRGGTKIIPSDDGDDNTQYLQRLPLCVINLQ